MDRPSTHHCRALFGKGVHSQHAFVAELEPSTYPHVSFNPAVPSLGLQPSALSGPLHRWAVYLPTSPLSFAHQCLLALAPAPSSAIPVLQPPSQVPTTDRWPWSVRHGYRVHPCGTAAESVHIRCVIVHSICARSVSPLSKSPIPALL
jgi:hypothetical protein